MEDIHSISMEGQRYLFQGENNGSNFFVIFFGNKFYLLSPKLSYLTPRSVQIFQSFHHPQLIYFLTPLKK